MRTLHSKRDDRGKKDILAIDRAEKIALVERLIELTCPTSGKPERNKAAQKIYSESF